MQAQKPEAQQLLLVDQVANVGPGEARAGGARAALLERPRIAGEPGVPQVQRPVAVSAEPVRAVRVGRTQSNMSIPAPITRRIPSASPIPMK